MPRLAIRSAVWILILLFPLTVTENKMCPEQNIHFLDPREDRLMRDSTESFWKQRPSRGNESVETVESGLPNKILLFRTSRNADLEKRYENASISSKTLMDYNGPIIMEDLDDTSNQDFTTHVRVKRNNPIAHRSSRFIKLVDSFPQNSWHRIDATNSTFEGSLSDRENRSGTIIDTVASHLRHKREVLSKRRHHRKRVKGNAGPSKHRVENKNGKKKHGDLKTSHQSTKKKTTIPTIRGRNNNARKIGIPTKTISKSKIEKRESGNSDLNTNIDIINIEKADLINPNENASSTNNTSLTEQKDKIMLPFVHTGRAELRVRIEKLPANESSVFISDNHWTDCPTGTSPRSIISPKYNASDEIFNFNVTNLERALNFDSTESGKTNNLTVEIVLKKPVHDDNASVLDTNDPEGMSFYNVESYPIRSNMPGIEDDRKMENEKFDRTNEKLRIQSAESSDEKSRAKRNQEITSKRYLRSDKNARGSKRFKDAEHGISIGDAKRGKMRYGRIRGNRAVKSIEEIKDLAEKLIIKINELQVYVNNRNETLHAKDSCLGNDANRTINEEKPRISLEKKDVSSSSSKIAKNNRQRFAKKAALVDKRTSQMHSGGSRFARGEYRTRRSRRKWGRWMDWSSCSVTCGKGRQIRWRHCLHDCNDAETEMEEKACQLPACPPSKFLGIF